MRELRDAWPVPAERPPLSLWAALIHAESAGHPAAVSPQGAVGLGQVMPSDFAGYTTRLRAMFRGRPTTAALLDPRTNLRWSLRILIAQGFRRCGSWDAALMAYFTGRCHAPQARDATGTTGAHYVALITRRRALYRDLDPPASPEAPLSDVEGPLLSAPERALGESKDEGPAQPAPTEGAHQGRATAHPQKIMHAPQDTARLDALDRRLSTVEDRLRRIAEAAAG